MIGFIGRSLVGCAILSLLPQQRIGAGGRRFAAFVAGGKHRVLFRREGNLLRHDNKGVVVGFGKFGGATAFPPGAMSCASFDVVVCSASCCFSASFRR